MLMRSRRVHTGTYHILARSTEFLPEMHVFTLHVAHKLPLDANIHGPLCSDGHRTVMLRACTYNI